MKNLLHLRLQAVVRLHFHATGDKPITQVEYDQYVDTLVEMLEEANDNNYSPKETE